MVTGSGEKRFHDQISWLMFLFSIFVIWVHSYNVDLFSGGAQDGVWSLADRIENFVSVGLGQIAVPGFFLLSSYLFFRNFSRDKLLRKWKSRVFSVLIPYVVWNFIYYLGYMAASRFLAIRSVVGRDIIPFSVQEIWRAVSQYAYAPIFWYLYQLIFLIIVSPLIYALVKNRAIGLFWIVGLVFAVHLHLICAIRIRTPCFTIRLPHTLRFIAEGWWREAWRKRQPDGRQIMERKKRKLPQRTKMEIQPVSSRLM